MKFRTAPANRPTRVLAALVLLSIGVGMIACLPMPLALLGAGLTAVAGAVLCFEVWTYASERWNRRDPYDLSLLDRTESYRGPSRDDPQVDSEAPDWDVEEGDTVYCHRCDVSMPTAYSICPKCGAVLGR